MCCWACGHRSHISENISTLLCHINFVSCSCCVHSSMVIDWMTKLGLRRLHVAIASSFVALIYPRQSFIIQPLSRWNCPWRMNLVSCISRKERMKNKWKMLCRESLLPHQTFHSKVHWRWRNHRGFRSSRSSGFHRRCFSYYWDTLEATVTIPTDQDSIL